MLGHSGGRDLLRQQEWASLFSVSKTAVNKEEFKTGLAGLKLARSVCTDSDNEGQSDITWPHPEATGFKWTIEALTLGRVGHVFVVAWASLSRVYRGHEQNALGNPYVLQGPGAGGRVGGSWGRVAGDKN